jgi:hypothetical protein
MKRVIFYLGLTAVETRKRQYKNGAAYEKDGESRG